MNEILHGKLCIHALINSSWYTIYTILRVDTPSDNYTVHWDFGPIYPAPYFLVLVITQNIV